MYGGKGRNRGGGGTRNGKEDCTKRFFRAKTIYSLKYDRQMLIAVEGDMNAKIIFKGNDEHGCLYVGGKDGPMRRVQKGVVVCLSLIHI